MYKSVTRPTLIINEAACRKNIRRMAEKAIASGVLFRPHFKTHQSLKVAGWFREEGVEAITVSSTEMAMKFAGDGWKDITLAFPVNPREIPVLDALAAKVSLNLLVDSPEVALMLSRKMNNPAGLFIEIDTGCGRSGLKPVQEDAIAKTAGLISATRHISFRGFLTHSGETYRASDPGRVREIYAHTVSVLGDLKAVYPDAIISIGDTPTCSIIENLGEVDEIRPGNFVFYDLMQMAIGSCSIGDIAVSVACPVAGIYPDRCEVLIYGGAVHLSKEYLGDKERHFGLAGIYGPEGQIVPYAGTRVVSLSQEHGIIRTDADMLSKLKHGDLLGVLPVHSCLTANLLQHNTLIV